MNDLVDSGEEGRGKQRYAPGSRKQALIRRNPNAATHFGLYQSIPYWIHRWIEANVGKWNISVPTGRENEDIPPVAASEKGKAQIHAL